MQPPHDGSAAPLREDEERAVGLGNEGARREGRLPLPGAALGESLHRAVGGDRVDGGAVGGGDRRQLRARHRARASLPEVDAGRKAVAIDIRDLARLVVEREHAGRRGHHAGTPDDRVQAWVGIDTRRAALQRDAQHEIVRAARGLGGERGARGGVGRPVRGAGGEAERQREQRRSHGQNVSSRGEGE